MSNPVHAKCWKCKACGSVVTGIDWTKTLAGRVAHHTPTGGECRAVNFDMMSQTPEAGTPIVTAFDSVPPAAIKFESKEMDFKDT